MAEPPRLSPRPDIAPELDGEPQTDPGIRVVVNKTRLLITLIGGGFSLISLGGVAVAYEKLRDAAADAGQRAAEARIGDVESTKRAVAVVDADLQQHKAAEAQAHRETQSDLHDVRVELRELYRAQMEGKRSAVLEKPAPPIRDGGRP